MLDHRRFAMHDAGRADDLPAVRFGDTLMAKTDAQDGNLTAKAQDRVFADSCFTRCARSRRNADTPWR